MIEVKEEEVCKVLRCLRKVDTVTKMCYEVKKWDMGCCGYVREANVSIMSLMCGNRMMARIRMMIIQPNTSNYTHTHTLNDQNKHQTTQYPKMLQLGYQGLSKNSNR